jgi:serine/threonine protein kinase
MTLRVGRYETLGAIASGGMATVYLGRAVGLAGFERNVAIKVMHPHLAGDPDFAGMFLDEARLAARIHHPNVVATIDVLESEVGLVLVMDYVEGPSLHALQRALRKAARALPIGIAVRVCLDALSGLHAAHEMKGPDGTPLELVHRDVSPANVLVGADGTCRITDFGVARATWRISTTQDGRVKGKLAYMPPEQIRGEKVDRRCDVYAAGVTLWELLVGTRAFTSDNEGALLAEILAGVPASPRARNAKVPAAINSVCMRAVALSRDERYATAADFAEDLEQAAMAESIPIATSRAVSAFVMDLRVHSTADEITASGSSPRLPVAVSTGTDEADCAKPFSDSISVGPSSRGPALEAASRPEATSQTFVASAPAAAGSAPTSGATSERAAPAVQAAPGATDAPRREVLARRTWTIGAAVTLCAGGLAAWLVLGRAGPRPPSSSAASIESSASPAAASLGSAAATTATASAPSDTGHEGPTATATATMMASGLPVEDGGVLGTGKSAQRGPAAPLSPKSSAIRVPPPATAAASTTAKGLPRSL